MDNPSLTSLSITHVYYNPADIISTICAYLSLVPQALTIVYAAVIWSTREIEIVLMFTGQMGCEALNWILKRYIREQRPSNLHGKGYGMPSSHAQYVAFFSTFFSLFLLVRHTPHNHPHASSTHIPIPYWQRLGLSLASLACGAAVAQSRIYLNYHRPKQVYVGIVAGVGCAIAWFIVTGLARKYGWINWMLDSAPARWARLRDLIVNEDFVDAGWERWEQRRRKRLEGSIVNGSKKQR